MNITHIYNTIINLDLTPQDLTPEVLQKTFPNKSDAKMAQILINLDVITQEWGALNNASLLIQDLDNNWDPEDYTNAEIWTIFVIDKLLSLTDNNLTASLEVKEYIDIMVQTEGLTFYPSFSGLTPTLKDIDINKDITNSLNPTQDDIQLTYAILISKKLEEYK